MANRAPADYAPRHWPPTERSNQTDTNHCTIAKRCPPCRISRNHWADTKPLAKRNAKRRLFPELCEVADTGLLRRRERRRLRPAPIAIVLETNAPRKPIELVLAPIDDEAERIESIRQTPQHPERDRLVCARLGDKIEARRKVPATAGDFPGRDRQHGGQRPHPVRAAAGEQTALGGVNDVAHGVLQPAVVTLVGRPGLQVRQPQDIGRALPGELEYLGKKVLSGISLRVALAEAVNSGLTIAEFAPDSVPAEEFSTLAKEVLKVLAK